MIIEQYIRKISAELSLRAANVEATAALLDEGATIPFIARYRKEATGSLDEVQITAIRDRVNQLRDLDKRRAAVLESIEKQGKLTEDLKAKIEAAETMSVLEDIYLPYRPKRRTRATIAKEKGLEPLAELILKQGEIDPEKEAAAYINAEKGVEGIEEALAGARDIIAEWVNENSEARARIRSLFMEKGMFQSKVIKGRDQEGQNYRDYFDWHESVQTAPSHRVLAVRRGEKEGFLSLRIIAPEDEAIKILEDIFVTSRGEAGRQVRLAIQDSYKRLLWLSMETEIRLVTKDAADRDAIQVFVRNLKELLMAPPLGQRNVLAVDPGFRTGCKIVCLNRQGDLLQNETVYIGMGEGKEEQAATVIKSLCRQHQIEFIAIGNGTGSREAEGFIRRIGLPQEIHVVVVNESGASIYSASEAAREEFPNYDVTVRGAVSIGRRLMDPLAELVKIDPKSIGVGQYQHDVDQALLKQSLDEAVMSCVNLVGVELNTASKQLLTYVSGLGPTRAQAIIDYRNQHGPFCSREALYQVAKIGPKAIEQSAGFLRIRDGDNPLDASAVHPESYHLVERMARDLSRRVDDLLRDESLRKKIDLNAYVNEKVGLPTLTDILNELSKPGRDPRAQFEIFQFKENILKPEDIEPGMKLPGIVTNVTNFGAFVDLGVHLDGLIHISQMSDKYVKDPNQVLHVHQKVMVTVLEVDLARGRIALSLRQDLNASFDKKKK